MHVLAHLSRSFSDHSLSVFRPSVRLNYGSFNNQIVFFILVCTLESSFVKLGQILSMDNMLDKFENGQKWVKSRRDINQRYIKAN